MSDANLIQLTLDHESKTSLFEQIYQELRERIVSGSLKAGSRLPSSRAFAQELGVSRSSIVNAYDQLIAEGYAESRPGSGVYVSELPELKLTEIKDKLPQSPSGHEEQHDHEVKPFYPGMPDMRLFPYEKWSRCVARVARNNPMDIINVKDRFGDIRLREQISVHLGEWRGITASPEQIIVTAGAIGGMELVIQVLKEQTTNVALENPGYKLLRNSILSRGIDPVYMNLDEQGALVPEDVEPKIIVLTPSHQYPLGGTMPTARRTDFLNYISRTESWIIEDDFDSEFRYSGKPIKALAGMDEEGRVFYAGSFSKIFSVGLRIGYLVVPSGLIKPFAEEITRYGKAASILPQRPLAEFMASGEFHKHIRSMRRVYGTRRKHFMQRLKRLEGDLTYIDYQAGMQVALLFPEGINDVVVSKALLRKGLVCPPLSEFYSKNPRQGLLIGYCSFTEEEIEEAMDVFQDCIKKSPSFGERQALVKG